MLYPGNWAGCSSALLRGEVRAERQERRPMDSLQVRAAGWLAAGKQLNGWIIVWIITGLHVLVVTCIQDHLLCIINNKTPGYLSPLFTTLYDIWPNIMVSSLFSFSNMQLIYKNCSMF